MSPRAPSGKERERERERERKREREFIRSRAVEVGCHADTGGCGGSVARRTIAASVIDTTKVAVRASVAPSVGYLSVRAGDRVRIQCVGALNSGDDCWLYGTVDGETPRKATH